MSLGRILPALAVAASPALADEKAYDFHGFTEVLVSAGVSVDIEHGDDHRVVAVAQRGDLDRLTIEMDGDQLSISRQTKWGFWNNTRSDQFHVTVVSPDLNVVKSSSGSAVNVEGFKGPSLEAKTSSGATLTLTGVRYDAIEAKASSGATLQVDGRCADLTAESASGAAVIAERLNCVAVEASSRSGASLSVFGSETAELEASSGASLHLHGAALILRQDVRSGASIHVDRGLNN